MPYGVQTDNVWLKPLVYPHEGFAVKHIQHTETMNTLCTIAVYINQSTLGTIAMVPITQITTSTSYAVHHNSSTSQRLVRLSSVQDPPLLWE